jgi:hypothetical protein
MPIKSPQSPRLPVSILAGIGSSLLVVSISESDLVRSSRSPQVAERAIELPLVAPIVSSDSTSDRSDRATTGVTAKKQQPSPLQSAHAALKQANVAVKLSQAHLAQARTNLSEFRAKHNNAKVLSARGNVSRQHADNAKAAYQLAQLQHKSASIGLQESQAQLIAAKAEVRKLGRKANAVKQM